MKISFMMFYLKLLPERFFVFWRYCSLWWPRWKELLL